VGAVIFLNNVLFVKLVTAIVFITLPGSVALPVVAEKSQQKFFESGIGFAAGLKVARAAKIRLKHTKKCL